MILHDLRAGSSSTLFEIEGSMFAVITYSVWLGIDAASGTKFFHSRLHNPGNLLCLTKDYNDAPSLSKAKPVFQVVENLFCVTWHYFEYGESLDKDTRIGSEIG